MVDTAQRPDGRRSRWVSYRAERRADFVAAGAAAVDRYGPEASAEQIAEVAEISRTVLYRYFRDRDDLRQAVGKYVVAQLLDSIGARLQVHTTTTSRELIESSLCAIITWFTEHPNRYFFLRSVHNGNALRQAENGLADKIASILKAFMMAFGVDADSAEPNAHSIVGLIGATASWWLTRRTIDTDELVRILSRSVWAVLEASAREHGVQLGYDDLLPALG